MAPPPEHFDVLIVGAGLSGIGAAVHLQKRCPGKRYAILEGRAASGGTWDLFRYPGVRSDSDMYTLGYAFRPWRDKKAIADGPSILNYLRGVATDYGVDKKIRYRHLVTEASWSSQTARWTVTALHDGAPVLRTCNFLWMCSGYYCYDAGYTPDFADTDRYKGRIVHPQHWPEDLDYADKRVVVIGSGATAVTLIPAMADKTQHITMLQRSPTYMFSMPAESRIAKRLQRLLPTDLAYRLVRWERILFQLFSFAITRLMKKNSKQKLIRLMREQLPPDYDVETHFTPTYFPWEQRLCLTPDEDLFAAIRTGRASVVTDHIERFTEDGVRLTSGEELKADIIVTATGLAVEPLGGAALTVDGRRFEPGKAITYKGVMMSGAPNMASIFGYLNASWTLRSDLISEYVCRLLNYMDRRGYQSVTPVAPENIATSNIFEAFSSGYIVRVADKLPKQGPRAPWRQPQNYLLEIYRLRFAPVADRALAFDAAPSSAEPSGAEKPLTARA